MPSDLPAWGDRPVVGRSCRRWCGLGRGTPVDEVEQVDVGEELAAGTPPVAFEGVKDI
jgi:hypothetical protein